jgi:galactokinase
MSMPDVAAAEAPGRVNLIGEHTDYHEGFVLPTVIPQRTRVALQRRSDAQVVVTSDAYIGEVCTYDIGGESPGRGWLDYVQGVTAVMRRADVNIPGFELRIESDVPVGAGVSSSAALTVGLLRGLRILLALNLDDTQLAMLAQKAETDFVGAPVGIMDQMVCSLGRTGSALFLDTRTLAYQHVAIPPSMSLLVIDSGVAHDHASGSYGHRRRESFEAASALGVERLRDIGVDELPRIDALPAPLAQRSRHIVTENARVLAAVDALRSDDPGALGRLFAASHASLRDDYEVSHPDVDALVEIAQGDPDVFGARMTGGGFGGAVVILARSAATAPQVAGRISNDYRRRTGRTGRVLVPIEAPPLRPARD